MAENENLSVKLFKYHDKKILETSTLVPYLPNSLKKITENTASQWQHWYRDLRRPRWIWQGVDSIELEEILAKIANSDKERSNPNWFDTVIGYREGNWAYEWITAGMKHQKKAAEFDDDEAAEYLFKASVYFSLAGYPHLKEDTLASQSLQLATQAYDMAAKKSSHKIEKIKVPYEGRNISCYLHTPNPEKPLPVVIYCGGTDALQTDVWRLYREFFAPSGIAMLTVDMPSVGANSYWQLTEDSTCLHQAVLNYLPNIPWVDHFNVGLMGFRFGGNVAVRLSFLEPSKLKACVSLAAPIHESMSKPDQLKKLPKMQIDLLASRLSKQVVDIDSLTGQLQAWSLKYQGFLSGSNKTSVPILAIGLEGEAVSTTADNKMVASFSQGGKAMELKRNKKDDFHNRHGEALELMVNWIKEKMNV